MPVFEERTIAYVDLLGSKRLVASGRADPSVAEGILRVLNAVERARLRLYESTEEQPAMCVASVQAPGQLGAAPETSVEMSAFSDCFAVSDRGANEFTVVARAQELAFSLLEEGFLCRGGVAEGDLHHRKGVLFGPALIAAYSLEQSVAVYPRIVVQEQLAQRYLRWEGRLLQQLEALPPEASRMNGLPYPRLLRRDIDGCHFVDLFAPIADLTTTGWSVDGAMWNKRFSKVRGVLEDSLQKALSGGDASHIAKNRWIVSRFNDRMSDPDVQRRVGNIAPIQVEPTNHF